MPQIEHNGPGFHYQVAWRRDIPGQQWNEQQLRDWQNTEFLVPNTPTFQPYKIKVRSRLVQQDVRVTNVLVSLCSNSKEMVLFLKSTTTRGTSEDYFAKLLFKLC